MVMKNILAIEAVALFLVLLMLPPPASGQYYGEGYYYGQSAYY